MIVCLVLSQIVHLEKLIKEHLEKLGLADKIELHFLGSGMDPLSHPQCATAEILLADPSALSNKEFFASCGAMQSLRWIQFTWAGLNVFFDILDRDFGPERKRLPAIFSPSAQDKRTAPVVVTRLGGVFAPLMAEWLIGEMIAHERKFFEMRDFQLRKEWPSDNRFKTYSSLRGKTAAVLGYGDIGRGVADAFKFFGMNVQALVNNQTNSNNQDYTTNSPTHISPLHSLSPTLKISTSLAETLANADYIINILPSTPRTRKLLTLDSLQPCATHNPVLLNVGRGDVIEESVLVSALDTGLLSHAILDVFQKEPLPADSALWAHPKVTISPHVSATSLPSDVARVFGANLALLIQGSQNLNYQVDLKKGY